MTRNEQQGIRRRECVEPGDWMIEGGGGDRTNIHHDVSKAVTENTIVLNGSLRRIRNR